jgi:hypothetical protein
LSKDGIIEYNAELADCLDQHQKTKYYDGIYMIWKMQSGAAKSSAAKSSAAKLSVKGSAASSKNSSRASAPKLSAPKSSAPKLSAKAHADRLKKTSKSKQILVIVPFADFKPEEQRSEQLNAYISHISKLIKQSKKTHPTVSVCVIVAEQHAPAQYFNKGQLLNSAVKWFCTNHDQPDYVIFNDVDMLPNKALFTEYLNINGQTALMPLDSEYTQHYGDMEIPAGGGIYGLPFDDFVAVNGYSNTFWGWGGEDNSFHKRLKINNKLPYTRVQTGNIKYIDLQRTTDADKMEYLQKNKIQNMMALQNMRTDLTTWRTNGYNNAPLNIVSAELISEHNTTNTLCMHHIKFDLDDTNLQNTIAHNKKAYAE